MLMLNLYSPNYQFKGVSSYQAQRFFNRGHRHSDIKDQLESVGNLNWSWFQGPQSYVAFNRQESLLFVSGQLAAG